MVKPNEDSYELLASLWSGETYGWLNHLPEGGAFQKVLREIFSAEEALALLDIPVKPVPLDFVSLGEIAARSPLAGETLERILDGLAARGLLFSGRTASGEKGYSLLKLGYGFSQVFYWKGDGGEQTRKLLELEKDPRYLEAKIKMFTPGEEGTKAWRYIPVTESIDPGWQGVYPSESIEKVIMGAKRFALAHCPCRVTYRVKHGKGCGHSTDLCIKMDELADCLLEAGLAREITRDEALEAIRRANREGLVHFTDNTAEEIKHICNCCGCACWNLVPIRRRQIPRDALMATYFIRETEEDRCTACGACAEVCPVDAVTVETGGAKADPDWCIGCGVCAPRCPAEAIRLREKERKPAMTRNLSELYSRLDSERRARLKGEK